MSDTAKQMEVLKEHARKEKMKYDRAYNALIQVCLKQGKRIEELEARNAVLETPADFDAYRDDGGGK